MTTDIIAALRKCRDQFEFYAQEHRIKVDAAVTALDDAKYWGNVDEQDKARKELEKRRKQAATNEEMVVMCDAALSTSPAGQEVRKRLKYYPDFIDDPDGLERLRHDVKTHGGHDMAAVNHNTLGRLIDTIERLRQERDAALSSVEPAGNGREAVENAFIAGWEAQKAGR
ncbi:hypothetical protein K7W03_27480, partial [Sphingobium sp. PNB]|uniref:hypothetical protein n=1 Tax=Sphingobium sp. PNB TaxID=863934 RepID=UPI001CA41613